jgi:DNA-binding MarR family transcriptional regulator
MTDIIDPDRLERRRRSVLKSRSTPDRHRYFHGIAETRYVLRKIFRLVEAQAKLAGIDPLAHQGLIQIYGSADASLIVKEIAERLDITPPFASTLVKLLLKERYVKRQRDTKDQRIARVAITKKGRELLNRIDERVKADVDYFTRLLSRDQQEAVVSVLMHYVGISFDVAPNSTAQSGARPDLVDVR